MLRRVNPVSEEGLVVRIGDSSFPEIAAHKILYDIQFLRIGIPIRFDNGRGENQ